MQITVELGGIQAPLFLLHCCEKSQHLLKFLGCLVALEGVFTQIAACFSVIALNT